MAVIKSTEGILNLGFFYRNKARLLALINWALIIGGIVLIVLEIFGPECQMNKKIIIGLAIADIALIAFYVKFIHKHVKIPFTTPDTFTGAAYVNRLNALNKHTSSN